MREILFRGKCKDTGKWYEGYYVHLHKTTYCFKEDYDRNPDNDMHQIIFEEMMDWGLPNRHFRVDVIPETVGQYTGLTDKNGKKIFEGDILVFCKGATHPIKVYWDGLGWKFLRNGKNIQDAFECNTIDHIRFCEIIGNIHDNPELLKGGAE